MKKICLLLIVFASMLFLLISMKTGVEGNGGYAGPETCKGCHPDKFESYSASPHGIKQDPRSPASREGCETCHGPGAAHASAGGGKGIGGIINPGPKSSLPAENRNAICLGCHERFPLNSKLSRAHWNGSIHESRGVACTNCHSIHAGYPKLLAKPNQTEVCTQCHKQIKAQLQRPSHHPIREGKINCTDCHNPHGSITERLISANSINEKCYECHAEKRGPFLWEHFPVTENCLTCHTPHGSSHDKLLVAKRPYLCQTCHSVSRHPGTLYGLSTTQAGAGQTVYNALNNRIFYRSCQNCHSQIHGSNHPSGKFLAR
jgi:DmsE family decaheme c-type cytochrome